MPLLSQSQIDTLQTVALSEQIILQYFTKNRLLLEGVVITRGEPTLQFRLLNFSKKIKSLELAVELDTNGSHPRSMKELIDQQLVNYIAMDI